jgi:hypothetical protein
MQDDVASEIAELRARVRALEDREEIRQLTCEYMQAMHDARWDDALACFADDASYDHGVLGHLPDREALREFYLRFMPAFEGAGGWRRGVLDDVDARLRVPPRTRPLAVPPQPLRARAPARPPCHRLGPGQQEPHPRRREGRPARALRAAACAGREAASGPPDPVDPRLERPDARARAAG